MYEKKGISPVDWDKVIKAIKESLPKQEAEIVITILEKFATYYI